MDINEVIKQIPFWKNLSDGEKTQLLSGSVIRVYKKRFLYLRNDRCVSWNGLCTKGFYQSLYHK